MGYSVALGVSATWATLWPSEFPPRGRLYGPRSFRHLGDSVALGVSATGAVMVLPEFPPQRGNLVGFFGQNVRLFPYSWPLSRPRFPRSPFESFANTRQRDALWSTMIPVDRKLCARRCFWCSCSGSISISYQDGRSLSRFQ